MGHVFKEVTVVPWAPNVWGVHCKIAGGQVAAYGVGSLQAAEQAALQLRETILPVSLAKIFECEATQPSYLDVRL
jgi:hypothetical protein